MHFLVTPLKKGWAGGGFVAASCPSPSPSDLSHRLFWVALLFHFSIFFFLYAFLPFVAIVEATGFGWGFWPESRLVAGGGGGCGLGLRAGVAGGGLVVIPLSSQLASADHYVALLFNSVICPS